jgi:hypothetical protein
MPDEKVSNVLIVANKTAATPALLDAVRKRATAGRARFHLLLPNPADHASVTEGERDLSIEAGKQMLALALPLIDRAAGSHVEGSVSLRHDPMDAIEETLHDGNFDEIILSTLPHHVSHWLHIDLPSRVQHLGLPLTTVIASGERAGS